MSEEKEPKFNVGDEVMFPTYALGNIGSKMTTTRHKCTVLESRKNVLGGYEYRLESKIKGPVSPDLWISESNLYEIEPEDNEPSVDYLYNIGDHVYYHNKLAEVVDRNFMILNTLKRKYYTVRYTYLDSPNVEYVPEAELSKAEVASVDEAKVEKEPETQKEVKVEYKPVDYKYEIGDTVKYCDKEYVIIDRYCFGNKFYTLNIPRTSEREIVDEKVLLRYNPEEDSEPKHEFHPTGDSSLADILMKGDFKEVYPAITEHFMKGGFKHLDYVHGKLIDNRDKTSMHPDLMRRTLMIPGFNIYDLGMGDLTPVFFDITTTVMVSQPLSNKSKDEILDNRCIALTKFINDIGDITRNIVVVDNLQFDRKPTAEEGELNHFDYLSTDIKLMKKIDYIIFAEGWQNSNGCNIEYQMAKTYGIPMYFA